MVSWEKCREEHIHMGINQKKALRACFSICGRHASFAKALQESTRSQCLVIDLPLITYGQVLDNKLIYGVLAAYYIAFGEHGPRAQTPPGEGLKVFAYTMIGVAASFGVFTFVRFFARGDAKTMTKEYQEATNEYLRVCTLLLCCRRRYVLECNRVMPQYVLACLELQTRSLCSI